MKQILIALFILALVIVALIFTRSSNVNINQIISPPQATIDNKTFNLIIAKTESEQIKGLSGMNSLDQNKGMLFIFPQKGKYSFWMKNMKFPIDIIFINDNKIVDIFSDVKPPSPNTPDQNIPRYTPKTPVNYVLEINTGLSKKYDFKIGDTVSFKNIK